MFPVRTILHPTDFSDCSRYAFHLASAMAKEQGARLVILHVKPTLVSLVAYGEALAQLEPEDYQEKLWEVLHWFQVPDDRVRVEHRLVTGDPAQEILALADEVGCDVIVMGSHGRTGLQRLIVGSVAEHVLRQARCPVVTVKTPPGFGSAAQPIVVAATPTKMTFEAGQS
jgi:nucleotide-binding universal stress UspA family protein